MLATTTTTRKKDLTSSLTPSSLVNISVDYPIVSLPDGMYGRKFIGSGLIVHLSEVVCLVLTDRNTVLSTPGDVRLDFPQSPCEVTARIIFLHPTANFAILRFMPSQLPPEARQVRFMPAASKNPHTS